MDVATARTIWGTIEKTTLVNLKLDLVHKALAYARIRSEWFFYDTEQRKEHDRVRTLAHNAFIDACNILSRNMAKVGEEAALETALSGGPPCVFRTNPTTIPTGKRPPFRRESSQHFDSIPSTIPDPFGQCDVRV